MNKAFWMKRGIQGGKRNLRRKIQGGISLCLEPSKAVKGRLKAVYIYEAFRELYHMLSSRRQEDSMAKWT